MYPEDVDLESGCRLPLPRREQLDDGGQRTYDSLADPKGGTIRGLRGPGGILLQVLNSRDIPGRSTAIYGTRRGWEDVFANWPSSPPPVSSTARLNGQRTNRRRSARTFPRRSSTARIRAALTRPTRSSSSWVARSSARGRWRRLPSPGPCGNSAAARWSISSLSWAITPGPQRFSLP